MHMQNSSRSVSDCILCAWAVVALEVFKAVVCCTAVLGCGGALWCWHVLPGQRLCISVQSLLHIVMGLRFSTHATSS
jgi:hypothetical protein